MKIAIHAADLDHSRFDGTRVYIWNMLKYFGKNAPREDFFIYHKTKFNPQLTPPDFENYHIKSLGNFLAWTHTRFAWEIFKKKPDVLWVPLHNLPLFRRSSTRTIITIHDLAFKFFPEYFTWWDLFKLNLLANHAIKKSDKIIAISNSTKKDILKVYPQINEEKIVVVHHGFDAKLFSREISKEESSPILKKYGLIEGDYLIYVGAIQPRKNLCVLIEAFEKIKKTRPGIKLVFAGERAWMWEGIEKRINESPFSEDIVVTGKIPFSEMPILLGGASVFVFPSLYEGFGIPVLEAFASGVPVVLANNSSLPEVGGDGALYFDGQDSDDLSNKIESLLRDSSLKDVMILKGRERLKQFSWEKCAQQTLDNIMKW